MHNFTLDVGWFCSVPCQNDPTLHLCACPALTAVLSTVDHNFVLQRLEYAVVIKGTVLKGFE